MKNSLPFGETIGTLLKHRSVNVLKLHFPIRSCKPQVAIEHWKCGYYHILKWEYFGYIGLNKTLLIWFHLQACLRDIPSFVPDHSNKANITIKWVTQIFWFPNAYKSYAYTELFF